MANISVLGAGGFGISLAIMATKSKSNNKVNLWSHKKDSADYLDKNREHERLLKGIKIPNDIIITSDISVVKDSDLIIIATPSHGVRSTAQKIKEYIKPEAVIACVSKGFEMSTLKLLSDVLDEELDNECVIISGPSHAEEVAIGEPTTVVVASENRKTGEFVQDVLMNPMFRIYCNDDVIGVELGAALKNVIALAAGCSDGLGNGDNAKAALMTRGMTEIARLGVAMGGRTETFAGLSGMGDLIVTCTSMHSRNRRAGILIGQGKTAKQAVQEIGMTVEGMSSAKSAYELSCKNNVEMPIIEQIYRVLYEDKSPKEALQDLMARDKKYENEDIWINKK